ncbi:FUCA1 [Cordylochernes scorpioides]|uniref:alpha-L-fucosidase n=1 Tax=Cordylochernes scorpioides TaxID=51811 RepID=A0ABY6KIB5_9ARAC|nr:FUCA1 [Cordylochernes scorpioides]
MLFRLLAAMCCSCLCCSANFTPTWESLDARCNPSWFDEGKVGIFVHWGLYSVPALGSEWFWKCLKAGSEGVRDFMEKNFKPGFSYGDFAPHFTAELFDPVEWAELFAEAGAKYVVLTAKHHDGFTLWPSALAFQWNAKALGPHRDLVGEFFAAARNRTALRLGIYYSLMEWFHPLYQIDKVSNFSTSIFVKMKTMPELRELVEVYTPDVIWADGEWEAPGEYWDSLNFLAWLFNESPVAKSVLVNDRWGKESICRHGSYLTCKDRYNPKTLQCRKWENAMTLDRNSWGFRRNANLDDYLTTKELIQTLIETVAYGGNILINVGPTHDGRILPIFQERLRDLGRWLSVNGDAIYCTTPWKHSQNDSLTPNVWYTSRGDALYALALDWPLDGRLTLGSILKPKTVTVLGHGKQLLFRKGYANDLIIELPSFHLLPAAAAHAFVLRLTFEDPRPPCPHNATCRYFYYPKVHRQPKKPE